MSITDKVAEFAFAEGFMTNPLVIVDDVIWRGLVKELRQTATIYSQSPTEVNEVIRLAGLKIIPSHFPIKGMFCVQEDVWDRVKRSMAHFIFGIPGVSMDPDWMWRAKGLNKPIDLP